MLLVALVVAPVALRPLASKNDFFIWLTKGIELGKALGLGPFEK